MATALIVDPDTRNNSRSPTSSPAPFLTTSLVVLSYLPDIVTQCSQYFSWYAGRQLGHSIIFALLVSPVAGFILSRQTSFTKKQCLLLGLSTILLHDLLDILQSTDRQPFWPFSTANIGSTFNIIPADPTREGLLFGLFYVLSLAWYLHKRNRNKSSIKNKNRQPRLTAMQKWGGKGIILLIIIIVLTTYHLRLQRIQTFQQAMSYFHQKQYAESLALFNKADRWPRMAKPGRLEYLKGIIYMKQHHPLLAEKYLLQSYKRDKNFFWCIGDLALLYAKAHKSRSQRRALVRPYLQKMQKKFSNHPDFPKYMQKIQHALANNG